MKSSLAFGRRLLLAGGGGALFWLAAGAAALVLVCVLYREERRLVARGTGLALLGLRLLAGAVLVLALFEPISARSYREVLRSRLILGVDLSDSMATVDANRSADDQGKLTRSLGLSPAEPPDILPRREIARRILEGDTIARLADRSTIEALGFARDLVPGTIPALGGMLEQPGRAGDAPGSATDWGPVLEQALAEAGKAPVLGVVLLTDGQQNGASGVDKLTDRLAARGVPVYPVLVGSTVPPRDAAVASVKFPAGVYKGDVATIEVTLKLDGLPTGTEVPVSLELPGAPAMRETVQVPPDGSRPVATFRVPLNAIGPQSMTVSVSPPAGDARADNDRRTVVVPVADDKAKVLLVEGEPRWEFQYVRNALMRDPHVEVDAVVFHQPGSAAGGVNTYKTSLPARPEVVTRQPDPLGLFDAIVLGDVAPGDLPVEAWARIEAFVAERGGTLVFSPGPRSWPTSLSNETARKLMPVLDPRLVAVDPSAIDKAHPTLPPGASISPGSLVELNAWPMLLLDPDPAKSRALWAGLPRLPWVLAGRTKPGATGLAVAEGAGVDVTSASGAGVVIAAQPYGLGKVLWVGTDGTWRWRFRVGDVYHHRFWGQVVRWASSGKLAAGNQFVRFGPVRSKVDETEGAQIQARIAEGVAGVGPDLLIAARIFKRSGSNTESTSVQTDVAVVPLRPAAGQPRTFEGVAPLLPQGSYVVRLDAPQLASALEISGPGAVPEATLEVAPRDTPERIELAARRDLVEQLAARTGGRVLADHEVAQLPELLHNRTLETIRTEETALWDKPPALILFFVLLTAEWVLRKRSGLP